MAKIHISSSGIPVKCPAKIQCRLAPDIGHFDKVEQAEAFADELNELRAENRSHLGYNSNDVKKMTDAELIYVSEKIKSEAENNENYRDYKGTVKWQKEVRSKASREMKELLSENNRMINEIGNQIDKVESKRKLWKNEKDPGKRKELFVSYKMERNKLNELRDSYKDVINSNMDNFKKLKDKKEVAEEKILNGMRKQAVHSETKAILADIESEIEERGASPKEEYILEYNNNRNILIEHYEIHRARYEEDDRITVNRTLDEKIAKRFNESEALEATETLAQFGHNVSKRKI